MTDKVVVIQSKSPRCSFDYLLKVVIEARKQQYSQIAARTNPPLRYDWYDLPYLSDRLIAIRIKSRRRGHWCQTSAGAIFHRLDDHTYPADERVIGTWIDERKSSIEEEGRSSVISDLLTMIHSRKVPLSQCVSQALAIARNLGNRELESFCRQELNGWEEKELEREPSYRRVEAYLSIDQVNTSYIGWSNADDIMNWMARNSERFTRGKLAISLAISKLEAHLPSDPKRDSLVVIKIPRSELASKSEIPKHIDTNASFVFAYTTTNSIIDLIESIRIELTRRLLKLM
jgi:hypothetical protein